MYLSISYDSAVLETLMMRVDVECRVVGLVALVVRVVLAGKMVVVKVAVVRIVGTSTGSPSLRGV